MRAAIIAFIVLAGGVGAGNARAAQLGIYAGSFLCDGREGLQPQRVRGRGPGDHDAFAILVPQTTTAIVRCRRLLVWLRGRLAADGAHRPGRRLPGPRRSHIPGPQHGVFRAGIAGAATASRTSTPAPAASSCPRSVILPLSYRWEVYARGGVLISNNTKAFSSLDDVSSQRAARVQERRRPARRRRHQLQPRRDLQPAPGISARVRRG